MPEHALALLDTSCAIELPERMAELAEAAAVSTLTIAELAYGIHHDDPLVAAAREARDREVLNEFDPSPIPPGLRTCTARSPHQCERRGVTLDHVGST